MRSLKRGPALIGPLPGPSVVPSCYHLNTRFTFGIRKIRMKVPIYCCQLLPSFIHSITNKVEYYKYGNRIFAHKPK